MIPARFGMLGFRYTFLPDGSLKREPVYSTNESVVLPLNLGKSAETPKQTPQAKTPTTIFVFVSEPTFNYQTHVNSINESFQSSSFSNPANP